MGHIVSRKIPYGLPRTIRDKWYSIDPEIQDYFAKILKENLDRKANDGRKKKKIETST